jgi:hypothetical protein
LRGEELHDLPATTIGGLAHADLDAILGHGAAIVLSPYSAALAIEQVLQRELSKVGATI